MHPICPLYDQELLRHLRMMKHDDVKIEENYQMTYADMVSNSKHTYDNIIKY